MDIMTKKKLFTDDDHLQGSVPYRHGVGILLLNSDKKVFVAQRLDKDSTAWQMPQGGIDPGEEPIEAAIRELKEETSITSVNILRETKDWFFYDFPNELAAKLWRGRFRGQRQKWFAMEFTGDESEINIDTEKPEFSQWQWVEPSQVPELIVDFKTKLYQAIIKEFSDELK
jgi:putative (di)nucleoside polyphosphate hydrolase